MRHRASVELLFRASARHGCGRAICSAPSGERAGTPIPELVWDRQDAGLEECVLAGGTPVKIRDAMASCDLSAHSITALAERFSDRQVEVEASINGGDYRDLYRDVPVADRSFQADVPLPLGRLLEHIQAADAASEDAAPGLQLYLAQKDVAQVLPELAIDPSQLPLKAVGTRLFQQSLWLGPRGTRTPLHRDPYLNLFCQVWGRKQVRVYSPEAHARLYPFPRGPLRNTSQVDTRAVNDDAFPGFQQAAYQQTVLGPGEALFLPRGWWHEVIALDGSLSLSFWWT